MSRKQMERSIQRKSIEERQIIQEVVQRGKSEKHRIFYGLDFKLVGVLNRFDLIPDFVEPIFICKQDITDEHGEPPYYFQVGDDETDTLMSFSRIDEYGEQYIQQVKLLETLNVNINSTKLFNIHSKPIYAFQTTEKDVYIGEYSDMKKYLNSYHTESKILREEIQDFLDLESNNIWERLRIMLEKYFPNDTASDIDRKLKNFKDEYTKLLKDEYEDKSLELYVPEFKDTVLRVGVRVKGTNEILYSLTEAGKELEELLSN